MFRRNCEIFINEHILTKLSSFIISLHQPDAIINTSSTLQPVKKKRDNLIGCLRDEIRPRHYSPAAEKLYSVGPRFDRGARAQ
jgi:hypothetical protein